MAGGRFELAMEPMAIGLVSLNSNSETHMIAICDARLIYGRGWISRVSCRPLGGLTPSPLKNAPSLKEIFWFIFSKCSNLGDSPHSTITARLLASKPDGVQAPTLVYPP